MDRCFRIMILLIIPTAILVPAPRSALWSQDRPSASANRPVVSKSTGMKLAWIPAGGFEMGSLVSEDGHIRSESQHTVRLTRPFYLGTTEVTQSEYEGVMSANPSAFNSTGTASGRVAGQMTERYPVENVSWFDAIEFCNKLSEKDGLRGYYIMTDIEREDRSVKSAMVAVAGGDGYRLPTEAEWEYACRGGSTTAYFCGDAPSLVDQVSWHGGRGKAPGNSEKQTHQVAQKRANGFGLYDMHGNVLEWCQDWYDYSSYERSPLSDPRGPTGGSTRVVRGGSWNTDAIHCRSARRDGYAPLRREDDLGFRVARSVISPSVPGRALVPPFRVVIDLRDSGTVDVYINETYDTLDTARERLAGSKFYGRVGNIRIIDGNGNTVD